MRTSIFGTIYGYLDEGKRGIVATVIYRSGSAPRAVGAKMFVGEDGRSFGTVGGGQLESIAYDEAMTMMNSEMTRVVGLHMDASRVQGDDMLCGGYTDLLLEPALPKHLALYEQTIMCLKTGEPALVITRFGDEKFTKSLLRADGAVIGDFLGAEETGDFSQYFLLKTPFLKEHTLIEPVLAPPELYIFGSGHVAQHLAHIAKIVGFTITVIDDREEFANSERFPDANEIVCGSLPDAMYCLVFTGNEFVVVMTRSHEMDAMILGEVMRKSPRYVGMIGSRRKVGIIRDHLRENGLPEADLQRVHAPIGVPIGAETPEEIAVAITAELIKVKAGHS